MKNTNNRGLELNNLILGFKNTGDEKYFEELWREVKPFAFKMGTKYKNAIENDEMEQIALICLFDCCKHIKEGTNVLTYYGKVLVHRYYDYYHRPSKRGNDKLNKEMLSLDMTLDNNGSEYTMINPSTEDDIFFIEDFYRQCELAKNEIAFIELLRIGYKQVEIVQKLHLTENDRKRTIKNIRKKILKNYDFGTI